MRLTPQQARQIILLKQGFHKWPGSEKKYVLAAIKGLGCIQIDTINVIERSHYLVLWSRLGTYEKALLDQLLYPDRRVFEFWAHAASIIPIEHYPHFIHAIKRYRNGLKAGAEKQLGGKAELLDEVLDAIRRRGPMSSRDFEQAEPKRGRRQGWWDWKPSKIALEMLFSAGLLMVAFRRNFQRYYDLTENVLPEGVGTSEPTVEQSLRFFLHKSLDAWGIAKSDYWRSFYYRWWGWSLGGTPLGDEGAREALGQLIREDIIRTVEIKGIVGPHYILSKDYEIAEGVAEGSIQAYDGVTFLSPFDNLTWDKERNRDLFDFAPKLELYLPKDRRKFGYYVMNILHKDRFVGRFDPKMHRESKVLEIRSLHLEKGFRPDAEFKEKLSRAFKEFMAFNGAREIRLGEMFPRKMRLDI